MSFRSFVRTTEAAAKAAGVKLSMAKLRDAIARACFDRPYAAAVAAEAAGRLPNVELPPPFLSEAAALYRIDVKAFASAFGSSPNVTDSAKNAPLAAKRISGNASILLAIDVISPRVLDVRLVGLGSRWETLPYLVDERSPSLFVKFSQRTREVDVSLRGYRQARGENYRLDHLQKTNIRDQLLALRTLGLLNPVELARTEHARVQLPFGFDPGPAVPFSWAAAAGLLGKAALGERIRQLHGCSLSYLRDMARARKIAQLLKQPPETDPERLVYNQQHRMLLAPAIREFESSSTEATWTRRWILPHLEGYPMWLSNPDLLTWYVLTLQADGSVVADLVVDALDCRGAQVYSPSARAGDRAMLGVSHLSLKEVLEDVFDRQLQAISEARHNRDVLTADQARLAEAVESAKQRATARILGSLPAHFDPTLPIADFNISHAGGSETLRRYRAQAVSSAPALADIVVSQSEAKIRANQSALIDAIDQAESLVRASATRLKVPVWVARRLGSLKAEDIELLVSIGIHSTADQIRLIRTLGPNAAPLGQAVLEKLRSVLQATYPARREWHRWDDIEQRYMGRISGTDMFFLRVAIIGNSARKVGWEALSLPEQRGEEISDYLEFACDCLEASIKGLYAGELKYHSQRLGRGLLSAFKSATIEDIERWSVRFHRIAANLEIREPPRNPDREPRRKKTDESAATSVLPPLTMMDGRWDVKQLLTEPELAQEGKEMQHCVRTYDHRVQSRSVAMFSLKSPSERITVMISRTYLGGWRLDHATGFQNAPVLPGSKAQKAVDGLLDVLELNDAVLEKKIKESYQAAAASRSREAHSRRFVPRVLDGYGNTGWRFFRHCLPGSAHGRMETKLCAEFLSANRRVAVEIKSARAFEAGGPSESSRLIASIVSSSLAGLKP